MAEINNRIHRQYHKGIAFKSISGIVILMVFFAVIITYIGYERFSASMLEEYSDGAILTAYTAANIVNGEDLYRYNKSGGETGDYKKAYNELQKLCNSTDSTFIYVIQPDTTDYKHIRFVFSIANYNSHYEVYDFGYLRETTNDEYREKYRSLYEQRTFSEIVVRNKGYIETDSHITAMIPLRGSDNKVKGILCVQRQLAKLEAVNREYMRRVVIVLLILSLIVIIGQGLYLHTTLLDPLQQIIDEARRFASDNVRTEHRLTDSIRNSDEIGMLARSIDQMEERIAEYIDDITSITAERERISAELNLANRIQDDMLPKDFDKYTDHEEFDLYASMAPAREVGGDFYDFFLIDDEHLGIVIADVSGKGIPAAMFMMLSMIIIKNLAKSGAGPAEVLEEANEQICSNNREEMFVTVWLGILDLKTGVLTASNAGHEYPVLMDPDGEFRLLKDKHGFVIGGMPNIKYTEYDINMEKGSRLFLYTDGLPEAQNTESEFFGQDRVVEELNRITNKDPEGIISGMRKAVASFTEGAPQFDDLTMLCLEYDGIDNKENI